MDAEKQGFVDYYELLGIDMNAGASEIRTGYLQLAKQHHPDHGGTVEAMRQLNKAYKTLIDHFSRAAYDRLHRLHNRVEELELHEGSFPRFATPGSDITNDEYVDYYVDSLYNEYHNNTNQKKPFKTWFSKIVSRF